MMTIINIWILISLIASLSIGILELVLRGNGFTLRGGLNSYILICIKPVIHLYFAFVMVILIFSLVVGNKQDRIRSLEETPEFATKL